ncbi:hypothetical protein D9M68_652120 [compost metagenome]
MEAELLGGLVEQLGGMDPVQRRQREVVGAVGGEGVALADHLALHRMGGAGGAEDLLGEVEVRLQFLVADPVVLDGHVLGDEFPAVALLVVTAQAQLLRHDPEMHAGPVQAGAADAVAGQEGGQLAVGQRGVVDAVADAHGALRQVLVQLAAGVVGQLVEGVGVGAVGVGVAVLAALQGHHLEARLDQLLGQDRAGPAEADHHRVHVFECRRHAQPLSPEIATGGKGYFSPRWAQSMKSARAPGKPTNFQPTRPRLPPCSGSEKKPSRVLCRS